MHHIHTYSGTSLYWDPAVYRGKPIDLAACRTVSRVLYRVVSFTRAVQYTRGSTVYTYVHAHTCYSVGVEYILTTRNWWFADSTLGSLSLKTDVL